MTEEASTQIKQYILRILRLIFGLFLYAAGIVVTIKANIGYAPWDVFHVGLARAVGISIGTASIAVGAVICILVVLLGEKLGLGTIFNMLLIGVFMDLIMYMDVIPLAGGQGITGKLVGLLMLTAGLLIIAIGSYFYIGSGFGAGPRDSLMVALKRKTGLPVGLCRSVIELAALSIGWLLGGMVGAGTIFSMVAIGFLVQAVFKLFKFQPETVKHDTLADTYNNLKQAFHKS